MVGIELMVIDDDMGKVLVVDIGFVVVLNNYMYIFIKFYFFYYI